MFVGVVVHSPAVRDVKKKAVATGGKRLRIYDETAQQGGCEKEHPCLLTLRPA